MTYFIYLLTGMRLWTQLATSFKLSLFMKAEPKFQELTEYPGISVVMPMKGVSESTPETLASLLGQDYPGKLELIIAVEDALDPAVKLVEETIAKGTGKVEVRLLKGLERIGLNPKSSNVMHAMNNARYPWLYCNDADSRPPQGHFRHMMGLVQNRTDHYATALSVHHGGSDVFAQVENVSSNLEITTYYMLIGEKECPVNGGAYLIHRELLEKIGGYKIALNALTEDLLFSVALKKVGAVCHKARTLVKTGGETQSYTGYMKRQVRWFLIAKCFKPPYFYMAFISIPTVWSFIWGAVQHDVHFVFLGLSLLLFRVLQGIYHQVKLGLPSRDWPKAWAVVVYDLFIPLVCVKTWLTTKVDWGGNTMHVKKNGDLLLK